MRTEKAVRRSDLCVLVVDLDAGVSAQDRKIAKTILDAKKPCLLVLNKFDLYHPGPDYKARIQEATQHVRNELFFLHYAPVQRRGLRRGLIIAQVPIMVVRHQPGQRLPQPGYKLAWPAFQLLA